MDLNVYRNFRTELKQMEAEFSHGNYAKKLVSRYTCGIYNNPASMPLFADELATEIPGTRCSSYC